MQGSAVQGALTSCHHREDCSALGVVAPPRIGAFLYVRDAQAVPAGPDQSEAMTPGRLITVRTQVSAGRLLPPGDRFVAIYAN
jgi:hypothetical protein